MLTFCYKESLFIPWDLTVKAGPSKQTTAPLARETMAGMGPVLLPMEAIEQGPCRIQWGAQHRRQTFTIHTDRLKGETWEILSMSLSEEI